MAYLETNLRGGWYNKLNHTIKRSHINLYLEFGFFKVKTLLLYPNIHEDLLVEEQLFEAFVTPFRGGGALPIIRSS